MSLTLAVPQRATSEAEANQVGKERMRGSYGLFSDRPHTTLQRKTYASKQSRSTNTSTVS
jgi:hypothetical protein